MSDSNTSIVQDEISQDSIQLQSSISILSFHPAEDDYVETDDIHEVRNYV